MPEEIQSGREMREKTWGECSDFERIDRLKKHVRSLIGLTNMLLGKVRSLEDHEHGANGKPLAPIRVSEFEGFVSRLDPLA